ncbi:MAG TPA: hypothetical protein VLE70_09445 [Anaerolineae bacterium]|jgi:hypothetical protein|nr:hypothetical protein [Anaerolineae bacterium]
MSLFDRRLKEVNTRLWDATRPDFSYPEIDDPELKVAGLTDRPNLGLAFSGGGTRSASATLGQLRGLRAIGLLQKARYVSCVSGSSFPNTVYAYLPADQDEDHLLGPVIAPEELTAEDLAETEKGSFAYAITHSSLVDDYLLNVLKLAGDETYSRTVGDNFLRPFGLDGSKRFFTHSRDALDKILAHNPEMKPSDFYQIRPDRPFPIINAIILRMDNQRPLPNKIPIETTPLYVGVRAVHPGAGHGGRDLGGGYVEPFAFDSRAPEGDPDAAGRVTVELGKARHRYTLSDAVGTSGAAPAEGLVEDGLDFLGFPEFRYWSPPLAGTEEAIEYEFGDGGNLENLAIMSLLARKVKRIIIFGNTRHPLKGPGQGDINSAIPPVFGQTPDFMNNAVFPSGQYSALVDGLLAAKREGRSLLFKDTYRVQDNAFHGIEGGWDVEVLWVYNERVPAWESALSAAIRDQIGHGSLERFPHFKTMGENKPAIIDLRPEQALLLSHLSCWNITANADLFLSMA